MEQEINKCHVPAMKLISTLELHYATHANLLSLAVGHAIVLLHALNACLATICYHLDYVSVPSAIWFLEYASLLLDAQVQFSMRAPLIA